MKNSVTLKMKVIHRPGFMYDDFVAEVGRINGDVIYEVAITRGDAIKKLQKRLREFFPGYKITLKE